MARKRPVPIGLILFFLFVTFTLLEIWLIFLLAEWTSWLFTIGVAIVSAIVGSAMAKREGLAVLARAQKEMQGGRFPGGPLADGVLILIGGALLITPGLITDLIGFSTLIPACRKAYRGIVVRWAKKNFKVVTMGGGMPGGGMGGFGAGPQGSTPPRPGVYEAEPGTYGSNVRKDDPNVVDVEFERKD